MPLFSIPVYRFHPHDLVYWSGASNYDVTYVLARFTGTGYASANDRTGDVILNQGGDGTRFEIPSGGTESFCRTLESNLAFASLNMNPVGPSTSRVLRLVGGVVRTDGGAAREIEIGRQLTAGDGTGPAMLTFTNDAPGSGTFTVNMIGVRNGSPGVSDNGANAVSVVVGDGVELTIPGTRTPTRCELLSHTGGTTINAGGVLNLSNASSGHALNDVWPLADVEIAGALHLAAKSTFAPNSYSRINVAPTVTTTGAGELTISGGLVQSNSLGGVMHLVYLIAGCSVAMSTIGGVIGGIGEVVGPVTVAANGYIMAGANGESGTLSVDGALTINGGSLYIAAGGFNPATGKLTTVGTIAATGAFTATSVSAVRLSGQIAAGTYEIITASSITGTLPDPVEPGNFSHYNYNATSIEIVLM